MWNKPKPSEVDDADRQKRSRRRHRTHYAATLLLVLVIAGLAWYAYPILQRHDTSLKEIPTMGHTISTFGDQLKQAGEKMDQKIAAWSQTQAADRKSLREELARTAQDLKSRMETAGQQARDSVQEAFRQARAEVNEKMDRVATRIATLESSRDGDQKQIAALQQQLGEVSKQVNDQAGQLATVNRQVQDSGVNAQERIAALKQDQDSARHDIGTLENKLAIQKVPFEASTGRVRELAEGLSLTVSGTDTTYRRANGWLWVAADRRNIWLNNLAAQEPLTFYGYRDGQKRELVITNVSKTGVTGYLLLPKEAQEADHPAAAAGQ